MVRHYTGESRAELNPVLHIVLPVVSAVAVAYVAYRSLKGLVAPVSYAPWVFLVYLLLGIGVLAYLRATRREEFLQKARLAMEESDEIGPHDGRAGPDRPGPDRPSP